jgi:putative ABC transport system ATP-binding protein
MDLEVVGVSKFFGKGQGRTRVLRDVSLSIRSGEFVAIVGTSGSGKTTLLNIMGGLDRGYDGKVRVDDANGTSAKLEDFSDKKLSRLRNQKFGFVFQQFNLLDHLTTTENIALPSYFGDEKPAEGASPSQRAHQLLHKVGLGDKTEDRPPQLSGGQKQRVAIARALFHQPEIIFCDEPTGSLDRKTGMQVMKIFQDLNRDEEMTLIVVTHEEHIARMASRIIRLEDGVMVADEPNEPVEPDELGLLRLGHAAGEQDDEVVS